MVDPKRKFCKWLTQVLVVESKRAFPQKIVLSCISPPHKFKTAKPPGPPLGTLGHAAPQVLINELPFQEGDH